MRNIIWGFLIGLLLSVSWTLLADNTHTVQTSPTSSTSKLALIGFTFANIGTTLTANGNIGFCSDCVINATCAGGGTGALAIRLNGVNNCSP